MPTNYNSIIDKLSEDPEFLDLPPEDQDQLIEELAQEKMGAIPKTENFLQRAMKVARGVPQGFADTYTLGGTALARAGADKVADMIVPPSKGSEQELQEMNEVDPTAYGIGASLPIAHTAQQLGKAGINALFGKQLAKKALPKATGKLSESIQEVIKRSKADPSKYGVPKKEVVKVLEEGFGKSKVPHGEQKAVFQRWLGALKNSDQFKNKPMLDADDISQIETAFGKAAKYGKTSNDPILQNSAREVNRFASNRMDKIAEKVGVPEFIKRSGEKSKLLTQVKAKPSSIGRLMGKGVEGAAFAGGGKIGYEIVKSFID